MVQFYSYLIPSTIPYNLPNPQYYPANDERKKAIELQKAKYELERSMHQRSQFVFDGEQFVYKTDDNAIKDNREKLAELELEETISAMEKEKEALQELIDELERYKNLWADIANARQEREDQKAATDILGENYDQKVLQNRLEDIEAFKNQYLFLQDKIDDNTSLIESYQEKIEYYEKLAEKWGNLTSEKEKNVNKQIAAELLGQQWEADILEDRLETFLQFQDQYLAIQQRLEDNTGLIDSYNEKIEYYQNLKQQWADIADAYENSINDQYAAMILGQNWEEEVLSGRIDTLNQFKSDYIDLQNAITKAAIESANARVEAARNEAAQINTANASIQNSNNGSGYAGGSNNSSSKEENNQVSGGFDDSDVALVNPNYKPSNSSNKNTTRLYSSPTKTAF